MSVDLNLSDRVIEAALALAPAKGWRRLTLADVAEEAGIGLAAMYAIYPSRRALLSGLLRYVDTRVLDEGVVAADQSTRERLFEIVMRRFDVLQAHRLGFTEILRELVFDPLSLLPAAPDFARSMTWMLEAAGVSTAGLPGNLRVKGLAAVYLNTLRIWIGDESVDQARTMAALDRGLKELEGIGRRLPGFDADWAAQAAPNPPPGSGSLPGDSTVAP